MVSQLEFDEEHSSDHGEAHQQHGHLQDAVPGGTELVWQDLHEGDVKEGPPCEPFQCATCKLVMGGHPGLCEPDPYADAQWRHGSEQQQTADNDGAPQPALTQLEGQAEGDDALMDHQSQADLQDLLTLCHKTHRQTLEHRVQGQREDQDEGSQCGLGVEVHVEVPAIRLL